MIPLYVLGAVIVSVGLGLAWLPLGVIAFGLSVAGAGWLLEPVDSK